MKVGGFWLRRFGSNFQTFKLFPEVSSCLMWWMQVKREESNGLWKIDLDAMKARNKGFIVFIAFEIQKPKTFRLDPIGVRRGGMV